MRTFSRKSKSLVEMLTRIVAFGRVTSAPIVSGYRLGSYFHEASFLTQLVPNCAYGLIDEGF